MKLLDNIISKSIPSKETLISWVKWIKRYCAVHDCSEGDCRYYDPGNRRSCCSLPRFIICISLEKLPEGIQPQEPPRNALNILSRVNALEIIDS